MLGRIIGFWLEAIAIAFWAMLKGIGIGIKWLLRRPRTKSGAQERFIGFCACTVVLGFAFAYSKFGLPFGQEHLSWHLRLDNTIRSYEAFISEHPQSRYVSAAQSKIRQLRDDKTVVEAALSEGTIASLERFLRDYPGHKHDGEIRTARKGRNILDLMRERAIEIKVVGVNIEKMVVRARRLVPRDVIVRIPPGTLFVSERPSVQSMVSIADRSLDAPSQEWVQIVIPVASASVRKTIPRDWDTFLIESSDPDSAVIRVARGLEAERASFGVRQAAVWIAADDATYAELTTLHAVSGIALSFSAIGADDIVMAMRMCERAGVDLARKAIWNDRPRLLANLRSQPHFADLAAWLEKVR